ncbi:HlyD family secretion protein [Poseidonibacter lekithochrous]|uniref:HlyD family efflux transporter periplasmic adaptor subunit n=1 Tax=Poseidonibacter TaxID=2321187 RepID=UPI001C09E619|nr:MULTISPECIES: HlyD family efflux transporter periplasmic adaptor subunit [Poseidonibacter]MBU3014924.1 HlyD family secretion protein [Poseidonibacter lekithochrous]MDO6828222.1 HlyD family efflux transporter periplasmic adaptor subunit [Poseidonibacter sp. 1_MG-2023]
MKKYLLILITPFILFAQSYMAKVQPYDTFTIYAQASGQIVKLDKSDETTVVNKTLIKLDTSLEQKQLEIYNKQLSLYNKKLKILEDSYKKYITLKGKSQAEKDDKLYVIIELQISIESLKLNIKTLQDTLKKKAILAKDLYIKEFKVNVGDYVSIGTELASTYDISKSKLLVYVSEDDYKDIENKKVLINGKENIATIEKIDKTLDETFVSAHKITLTLKDDDFGKVLKVEFVK